MSQVGHIRVLPAVHDGAITKIDFIEEPHIIVVMVNSLLMFYISENEILFQFFQLDRLDFGNIHVYFHLPSG